jgi:hypothetical protein
MQPRSEEKCWQDGIGCPGMNKVNVLRGWWRMTTVRRPLQQTQRNMKAPKRIC